MDVCVIILRIMRVDKKFVYTEVEEVPQKQKSHLGVLILASVALIAGFYIGTLYGENNRYGTSNPDRLNYDGLDVLYNQIKTQYDGEIDTTKMLEGAKKGMVAGLGDDYSVYFTSEEAKEFLGDLEGDFEGIGAELDQRGGQLTVVSVVDGSPAQKSGLTGGDVIAMVDDEDSINWTVEQGVAKIRGDAGTVVRLTILRGSEILEKEITRAHVTDPSVRWEIKDGHIGYMRISRFDKTDTMSLAEKAAGELASKGVTGLILDLRGNSGGYVDTAEKLAGLWLKTGQAIVEQRGAFYNSTTSTAKSIGILNGIPTVVLANSFSASAAEIVVGALKDNSAATVLGTKTYGKGVVQSIKELVDGGSLKLTIAKWYTPSGVNINKEGIVPDEELEFDSELYNKDRQDNQLKRALEILRK